MEATLRGGGVMRIICLSVLVVWSMGVSAQQQLILANSHSWAPLSFSEGGENADGLLIEFWQLYSKYSGQSIEFRLDNWAESIEMVKDNRAMVHAGLLKSPKRQGFFYFSEPLFPLVTGLFMSVEKDTKGALVGVVKGSYEAEYLAEKRPDWRTRLFDSNKEMIQGAMSGEVEGFVADYPTGKYFIKEWRLGNQIEFTEFLYSKAIHAAVALENRGLIKSINKGIAKIPKEELEVLMVKWEIMPAVGKKQSTRILWVGSLLFALLFSVWVVGVFRR